MDQNYSAAKHNRLNLTLKPVFIGELLFIQTLTEPAYAYENGKFKKVIAPREGITSDFVREYAQSYSSDIFLHDEDYDSLRKLLNKELTKQTRSLSIGDATKNATRQVNLLSMQMSNLYKNPFDDELLTSQFQNTKNLSSLLLNNKGIQKNIYNVLSNSKYHYTHTQPLLSSIMLLSFMQETRLFSEKEMEGLFLTSYFKDIGMSFIPREKFEQSHLNDFDKKLFAEHAENSMKILEGRVPLSNTQLNLIKNHHFLNHKIQSLVNNKDFQYPDEFLAGLESNLVSALDILVAMTHDRPYRDSVSIFQSLEVLKSVLSDEYPQEFKALVIFLKNFTSK